MRKTVALLVTTVVATATLAGCGGDSEYCAAVKKDQATLDSFGTKKTDAAFTTYRRTTRSLAKIAPDDIRKDWSALSTAVAEVLAAQKAVDLKLEDVSVEAVSQLSAEQSDSLNDSYRAFTRSVAKHGKRVAANIESECDVELK